MRRLMFISILLGLVMIFTACGEQSEQALQTDAADSSLQPSVQQETEPQIFDISAAYANKPYTNEFAQERKSVLDGLNDITIFDISSNGDTPQFYSGFFNQGGKYNVTFENYAYDLNAETVKEYFDTWEYSRFANWGATKIIDSFVVEDDASFNYLCYYTVTILGDNGDNDVVSYCRDTAKIDKNSKSISIEQDYKIKENLEVPKEISGENNFSDVI